MHLDEILDGAEQALAQAGLVGAAVRGRNQVDIGLAHHGAFLGPGHHPGRALALGEALGVRSGVLRALEQRDQGVAVRALRQRLGQIAAQALGVEPGLDVAGLGVGQRDGDAGQQHRLRAQQALQLVLGNLRRIEILRIRQRGHARAGLLAVARGRARIERLDHLAVGEDHMVQAVAVVLLAPDRDLQARRQRVGDRDADAVQPAGEGVGAAGTLVELAAGVQAREDDLHRGHVFLGMQADRNAAAVILDGDAAVDVLRHGDEVAVTAERLVGRVVDHLLNDMQRILSAGIHPRALLDGFQSLQDADG